MPIYEYRCEQCGHELERLQRLSDEPLRDCPACERPGLRRLVSAAGFRLKGSGWYETDFKQGQKRNLADGGGQGGTAEADKPKKPDAAAPNAPAKAESAPKQGAAAKPAPANTGS